MKQKVVITDYQYDSILQEDAIIRGAGFELVSRIKSTPEQVLEITKDADAIITQYCDINAAVIDQLEHCKIIIKYGIGINNIDADAAAAKGIYVCNVPDYGIDEVSNHAIAMLFALNKKLPIISGAIKQGDWGYSSIIPLRRLAGSTLGLVGFGRIPQAVAQKMAGFGVRTIAYDPYCSAERMAEMGVEKVDIDTLCRESDNISIHCPYTPDTHHMFDAAAFAIMKPSAFLINTARGPIVDEHALLAALKDGTIAGAGLDVFESEPITPEHPLLQLPNVIATPHCAWYSEEAISVLQRSVAEEVVRVLQGNPPLHPCNAKQLANYAHMSAK